MSSGVRREQTIEPGRARRALFEVSGVRTGPGQFRVWGNDEDFYDVDLAADQPCYCRDQEIVGRRIPYCKHRLWAMMASGDLRIIRAVAELVYEPKVTAERESGEATSDEAE